MSPSVESLSEHVTSENLPALNALKERLAQAEWKREILGALVKDVAKEFGLKMPKLAMPVRVLVTGEPQTPFVTPVTLMPLAPQVEDATAQLQVAQAFLDVPHTLQAYDAVRDESFTWELDPGLVATWLAVAAYEDGVQLDLSTPAVEAYLATLSGQMGAGRGLDPVQDAPRVKAALLAGETASVRVELPQTPGVTKLPLTALKASTEMVIPRAWKAQRSVGRKRSDVETPDGDAVSTVIRSCRLKSCSRKQNGHLGKLILIILSNGCESDQKYYWQWLVVQMVIERKYSKPQTHLEEYRGVHY